MDLPRIVDGGVEKPLNSAGKLSARADSSEERCVEAFICTGRLTGVLADTTGGVGGAGGFGCSVYAVASLRRLGDVHVLV